ncbi:MAG: beta-agarase, partial [Victivallales bacterium]|nr:beta-agarase [Victivallales bacterium]
KYGVNWQDRFAGLSHRRLRSWGVNTMANWSSEAIYLKRKTPYVVAVHFGSPDLRASKGMWKKFSDVFDPGFREGLAKRLAREAGKSAGDPWCIGYFVDNELGWGKDVSLAVATLCCPADQPAKRAFVADLKAKYREIAALNTAWGTSHSSWEALLAAMGAPDVKKAGGDLRDFYSKTAETYFRTVREEVKRIAPEQLYLGCRFSNRNDRAVRAAAVYCDVISFNRY